MWKTPFFRFGLAILLASAVIFMLNQINFVFQPLILFIQTVTIPFIIAGILYYIFLPLFKLLINKGLSKVMSIVVIYGSFVLVALGSIVFLGPILSRQVKRFVDSIPSFAKEVETIVLRLLDSETAKSFHLDEKINIDFLITNVFGKMDDIFAYVGSNVFGVLSSVTGAALVAIIIPFVLFYLLKDGDEFAKKFVNWFPLKHQEEVKKILSQMNYTLSSYIQGQLLVSLVVGFLIYIGYLIIGLDYSLFLALIATVSNVIPFLGAIIGLVFALLVGMMHSLKMTILVVIVVMGVQAIDSNFISPKILGKKLDMHPLTIIFILLFAGNFAGIIGMLIAVPIYALSKIFILNAHRLWKLKTVEKQKKQNPFIE